VYVIVVLLVLLAVSGYCSMNIFLKPVLQRLSEPWCVPALISYLAFNSFPIGYEEVRSISNPPADVRLGGGFEIDVSAAAIMKRFEQISDEDLNKK
jgi:hypothetical protein